MSRKEILLDFLHFKAVSDIENSHFEKLEAKVYKVIEDEIAINDLFIGYGGSISAYFKSKGIIWEENPMKTILTVKYQELDFSIKYIESERIDIQRYNVFFNLLLL